MSDGSRLLFGAIPANLKLSNSQRRALRDFARTLGERLARERAFTCLLTNDSELRRLNHQFLRHDYATDVLSFPAAEGTRDLGEIAISVERAAAQAEEFRHSTMDEIRILMLHGLLHLTGFDHERDDGEMEIEEERWRGELGLTGSLIRRTAEISASRRAP